MNFFLLKYAHIANIDSDDQEEEDEDDSRAVEHRRRLNERASEAYAAIHAAPPAARPVAFSLPRPPLPVRYAYLRSSVRPSSTPAYLLLERPTSNGMEL